MKKSLLISSLFVLAALTSQSALADVRVRAGVSSSTYELSGDYGQTKATYHPINLGVTYAANNGMYIDLAVSDGSGTHNGYAAGPQDFKRTDVALIVGASMLNQNNGIAGTVYAGLKSGSTTLNAPASTGGTYDKFSTSGLVFGGGASFPVAGGSAGAVGVNLGLGLMGNTWTSDFPANFSVNAKTAFGTSLGVSYTFPFTSSFGVIADYKYNSYTYKFDSPLLNPNPFTVNEKISNLGVSVYAKF